MTAPKPMDPKRLDEVREIAEHPSPRQLIETALVRELVDDRDCQTARADEWERKAVTVGADGLAEVERLRAALRHIANGNIAPSMHFAERILAGDSVQDAHAKAKARLGHG